MVRKTKLINNTNIPPHAIETFARCVLPDIQAFFATEEGQREFAEWQAEQAAKKSTLQLHTTRKRAAEKSAALVVIEAFSFLSVLWVWIRGESPSRWESTLPRIL